MNQLINAALDYIQKNKFNIVPLAVNSKAPPETFPLARAYKQPLPIEELITWFGKPSVGNIGLVLGETSGLAGIDIDDPAAADEMLSKYPTGLVQKTPSGGVHLFYKLPEGAHRNFTANGMEVYFRDRYFLISPSELRDYRGHNGRVYSGKYEWLSFREPVPFPAEIPPATLDLNYSLSKYSRREINDLLDYVELHGQFKPSQHNDTLFYGSLIESGNGRSLESITAKFLRYDRNDPTPQGEYVVRNTVRRAFEVAAERNQSVILINDVSSNLLGGWQR